MIIISEEGKAYNVEVTAMHGDKKELAELVCVMQQELERKIIESSSRRFLLLDQADLLDSLNSHTHEGIKLDEMAYELRNVIDIY